MIDILIYLFSAMAVLLLVAAYLLLILSVLHHTDRKDNDNDGSDNR